MGTPEFGILWDELAGVCSSVLAALSTPPQPCTQWAIQFPNGKTMGKGPRDGTGVRHCRKHQGRSPKQLLPGLGVPGTPIYSSDRLWVLPILMGFVSVPLTPQSLVLILGPASVHLGTQAAVSVWPPKVEALQGG